MTVYRINIHEGHGASVGNALSGAFQENAPWIEIEEQQNGVFVVTNDNMTDKTGNRIYFFSALGFQSWDNEVQNLDAPPYCSDEASCLGLSIHLRWKDVDLQPEKFRAPSIHRLVEALAHIVFAAYCPGDI